MHIHHLTPIQCECPRACLPTRLRIDSPPHDDHLPDNDGKCLGPVTGGVLQHPERDDVRVEVPLGRAGQEMHRSVGASWDRHRWHTSFLSQIYVLNFYLWGAKDLAVFWAFKIIFILFLTSNLIFVVVLWEYMAARFILQFSRLKSCLENFHFDPDINVSCRWNSEKFAAEPNLHLEKWETRKGYFAETWFSTILPSAQIQENQKNVKPDHQLQY